MPTQTLEIYIKTLIKTNELFKFYHLKEWKKLSQQVLKEQHFECQICKAKGKITRAKLVHHVHHVRDCPRLALSRYDDDGNRNLIAVCDDCHKQLHRKKQSFTNEERW